MLLRGHASLSVRTPKGRAPCPLWPALAFGRAGLSSGTGKSRKLDAADQSLAKH